MVSIQLNPARWMRRLDNREKRLVRYTDNFPATPATPFCNRTKREREREREKLLSARCLPLSSSHSTSTFESHTWRLVARATCLPRIRVFFHSSKLPWFSSRYVNVLFLRKQNNIGRNGPIRNICNISRARKEVRVLHVQPLTHLHHDSTYATTLRHQQHSTDT